MKYPKEIIRMSLRLGHTPEYIIQKTIEYNYSFVFFYIMLTLINIGILNIGILTLKENTIISDIFGIFSIISSIAATFILNILSIKSVIRSIFDQRDLAIEILIREQKDFEKLQSL